jgi:kumamolisin
VGGTNLVTQSFAPPNFNSSYIGEIAVEDPTQTPTDASWGSGGGISVLWAKPHYQTLITTPSATSRTVPDLALHMGGLGAFGCPAPVVACPGPNSSDILILGGETFVAIGTSASAPDIAGLFALKVAQNGANGLVGTARRLGWENIAIYTLASGTNVALDFHHTGIQGFNGTYSTSKTTAYDLVLGNGTVDARQFLGATGLPAAGNPGSTTNP